MDQYNDAISDFFKNEKHWNKENRVYEEELFELIKKFDTNFDVFSESRNYEHCITFTIDYESNGLSHSTFDNSLIENHNFETSSETIEFYRMAIYVSDILPLLNCSWNQIKLTDKKSIQNIPKNSLPEPIKIIFQKLETTILTETKFVILDSNQLNKKATWFQHPQLNVGSMYQPTYFDLFFGGLDLYNALGI